MIPVMVDAVNRCGRTRTRPKQIKTEYRMNTTTPIENQEACSGSLACLVSELKAECNRYANGSCQTLYCLKRGGYQRGDKPDYDVATCKQHEQVKALETLLANIGQTTMNTDASNAEQQERVRYSALLCAVGPCADPVRRVNRLYMVNTTAGNVKGQLGILADMSRDNGVPAWYCERLRKLVDAILTVGGLEAPNKKLTDSPGETVA
jgi:hypothetical protein